MAKTKNKGKTATEQESVMIKLQWPIVGDDILAYSRDRVIYAVCAKHDFVAYNKALGNSLSRLLKLYVEGYLDKDDVLIITSQDVDQTPGW